MSLSFPLLISAVPLHAIDFELLENLEYTNAVARWCAAHPEDDVAVAPVDLASPKVGVHWFSDGGICANLPVRFFDSPLPTRPTFAINLAPFPPGQAPSPDEADNSYLPTDNEGGRLRTWHPWDARNGLAALLQFGTSIVATARTWVDEAQLTMPGYRDRVVTIFQGPAEGGINLNMAGSAVQALGARGAGGADKLVARFAGDRPGVTTGAGWENHRWVPFRTSTAGLSDWLETFCAKYAAEPVRPLRTRSSPVITRTRRCPPIRSTRTGGRR